ncbi:histidine kinase dimerization/phosphoacceptor domain -containing protein [Devosia sp.]|uniref:sensor histidine kinase n=1 Tax=Devosia sp. TaxID=1871048 RepID=UPI003265512C
MNLVENLANAQTLAQAIVNTIPEPFLVLDGKLRVLAASRSFYSTFKVNMEQTQGQLLYALGDGQWDIPALRLLLETIIPEKTSMDDFEVEHDFPNVGLRTMLLNARKVLYDDSSSANILLAFRDVTATRIIERDKEQLQKRTDELLHQKQVLLQEMQHRVANSLQIIASILLLKARAVTSEEAKLQLRDAHQRVMSVAAVQQHLHASEGIDQIEVRSYLTKLCESLVGSMVGESQPISVTVEADVGMIVSADAVSVGLIVTELLINAIKYAFVAGRTDCQIKVSYEINGTDWKLVVADNGSGKAAEPVGRKGARLGTAIIGALVSQLDAQVSTVSSDKGMAVTITHATFISRLPLAS